MIKTTLQIVDCDARTARNEFFSYAEDIRQVQCHRDGIHGQYPYMITIESSQCQPDTLVRTNDKPAGNARGARVVHRETARRILIANAKGGCGKSTVAANLASYYARQGIATALVDYDEQGSSSHWLKQRSAQLPPILGIEAFRGPASNQTRNWITRLPRDIRRVIVDTPAALNGAALAEQVRLADLIVVPVLPSPVDIHAAAHFIGDILLCAGFRSSGKPLLVMANRVRKNTRIFASLDRFLSSLQLPRLVNLRDTQNYIHCAEAGTGIADLHGARAVDDQREWQTLVDWLETQLLDHSDKSTTPSHQVDSICSVV